MQKKIVKDLIKIVGKANVLAEKEDLIVYSYDGTTSWVHGPAAARSFTASCGRGMPKGVMSKS